MLSPVRTYILQIDTEAEVETGQLYGRLESLRTGEVVKFRSAVRLLQMLYTPEVGDPPSDNEHRARRKEKRD